MGKAPAFQFYPGDWVQDTRPLSLAAKGAWIDLLCAMWRSQTRGSLTMSIVGYSRIIGATVDQTKVVIAELTEMQICDYVTLGNGDVTLINRRMRREEKERNLTRSRVQKFRKRECNAGVTDPSSSSSSSSVQTTLAGSDKIASDRRNGDKPKFSYETGEFSGLGKRVEIWTEAYPAVDVASEIRKAAAWLVANPKNRKQDLPRFLNNWLSRTQDRAPRAGGSGPSTATTDSGRYRKASAEDLLRKWQEEIGR